MTEVEWLVCSNPQPMLDFCRTRASARKLRLFACACCREVWHLLTDEAWRHAVEFSERYADGQGKLRELAAARTDALIATRRGATRAAVAAYWASSANPAESVSTVCAAAAEANNSAAAQAAVLAGTDRANAWDQAETDGNEEQAELLRHILGNPFRPCPAPARWPALVTELATARYAGQDCTFALHDTLLEAGYEELAAHFENCVHPRGCWALDLILGKN